MAKTNIMDILRERGFIKQTVYEDELYKLFDSQSVTFYIGFDPTADSLHIGSFVQLMAMAHMLRAGHKPIALIGGGTGMIGDPSGKSDLREVLNKQIIEHNCTKIQQQIKRLVGNDIIVENNADWLLDLNYVEFLKEVGIHFSVNRMLTAECFKQRLEKGLSFFEFNYMLMQAYDFLVLNSKHNCQLQMGGDDQWSNILAGVDLVRRKQSKPSYAITLSLLLTKDGVKMGKTAKGAVWLDAQKTPPYDLFQYLRNVDDSEVENCLKLLTFLDVEQINQLVEHKDQRINNAKRRLAYEVTAIIHGKDVADQVDAQVQASFSNDTDNMPCVTVSQCQTVVDVLIAAQLASSRGEAKRLIDGGGVRCNDEVARIDSTLQQLVGQDKQFVLHKGKKVHIKIVVNE